MPSAASWTDLEIFILSENGSQTEKDKYTNITCVWNLKKKDKNELIDKTGTDSPVFERPTYGYQRRNVG